MGNINPTNEWTKVAHYYYKMGMTQDNIAKKMSMSRQKVNRILKKCIETGIVKIVIEEYDNQNVELEIQLENLLGLKEVVIVNNSPLVANESVKTTVSTYLERVIKNNDIIGFSRGRALSSLVDNLLPIHRENLTVTQLVGGVAEVEAPTNSDDIVRHFSEIFHAKPRYMYTPIILESKQLRNSLMNESFFSNVYNTMKSCTIAIVGIGDMSSQSSFVEKKYISQEELLFLNKKSAIGEVCTHYFDEFGNIIDSSINHRVLAIDIKNFQNIPLRIGVASGEEKVAPIIGASRGKLINALITNVETATLIANII